MYSIWTNALVLHKNKYIVWTKVLSSLKIILRIILKRDSVVQICTPRQLKEKVLFNKVTNTRSSFCQTMWLQLILPWLHPVKTPTTTVMYIKKMQHTSIICLCTANDKQDLGYRYSTWTNLSTEDINAMKRLSYLVGQVKHWTDRWKKKQHDNSL